MKTRLYLPKGWWTFKFRDDLIYIEKDSNKVLATGNGVKIIEEDYKEGKHEQLWKIGEANTEGYFTLENYKVSKFLTASSSTSLELKGNVKFIYSEKATKFCEVFPLLLTGTALYKIKGNIFQNFVTFSEYMNFTCNYCNSNTIFAHVIEDS